MEVNQVSDLIMELPVRPWDAGLFEPPDVAVKLAKMLLKSAHSKEQKTSLYSYELQRTRKASGIFYTQLNSDSSMYENSGSYWHVTVRR